jgi:MazG family protein
LLFRLAFSTLIKTIRTLIGPGGCPWDRCQTVDSLASHVVEEAWEFYDEARRNNNSGIVEELGDLLMLILLICAIGEKEQLFSFSQVASAINEKLIRRHPHVFGSTTVNDTNEVKRNWDEIKRGEGKFSQEDPLPFIPDSFPALAQAEKLGKAASKIGFEWPDMGGPIAKVSEEWEELKEAIARNRPEEIEHETGDIIFAITSLCRFTGIQPEFALRAACNRFRKRFLRLAAYGGKDVYNSLATMERYWEKAKKEDTNGPA